MNLNDNLMHGEEEEATDSEMKGVAYTLIFLLTVVLTLFTGAIVFIRYLFF